MGFGGVGGGGGVMIEIRYRIVEMRGSDLEGGGMDVW